MRNLIRLLFIVVLFYSGFSIGQEFELGQWGGYIKFSDKNENETVSFYVEQLDSEDSDSYKVTDIVIPVDTKLRDASLLGVPAAYLYPATHGVLAYHAFVEGLLETRLSLTE